MTIPPQTTPSPTKKTLGKARHRQASSRKSPSEMLADSRLFHTVRKMHDAQKRWVVEYKATGNLNEPAMREMIALRQSLYASPPATKLDALFVLGAIRSVAGFYAIALHGETEDDETHSDDEWQEGVFTALVEILHGIDALRLRLEADAGCSLASLGLFQDSVTVQ